MRYDLPLSTPPKEDVYCPTCGGFRQIEIHDDPQGKNNSRADCPHCKGSGRYLDYLKWRLQNAEEAVRDLRAQLKRPSRPQEDGPSPALSQESPSAEIPLPNGMVKIFDFKGKGDADYVALLREAADTLARILDLPPHDKYPADGAQAAPVPERRVKSMEFTCQHCTEKFSTYPEVYQSVKCPACGEVVLLTPLSDEIDYEIIQAAPAPDLETAWRMMEKKGPHYDTCAQMLDKYNPDVECDCGYKIIHRLVLATPKPTGAAAPGSQGGRQWTGEKPKVAGRYLTWPPWKHPTSDPTFDRVTAKDIMDGRSRWHKKTLWYGPFPEPPAEPTPSPKQDA